MAAATHRMNSPHEDDLLSGAAWTAEAYFTELYTLHYRRLVRAWQRLRDAENALAYVRQVVVNRSRSVLRHQMVAEKYLADTPPDMPSAEHGALVSLQRDAVVAALQRLTARQREAIVLRYYADLSEAEIAEAMGISRGAVKSHTARGMAALRAALEKDSD
jgi:RNA polymerase sigma-70 factor (sigma-E family)